jgi:hypothetical protein
LPPLESFARLLPANGKIFPRNGTPTFFSSPSEAGFRSIVKRRSRVETPEFASPSGPSEDVAVGGVGPSVPVATNSP